VDVKSRLRSRKAQSAFHVHGSRPNPASHAADQVKVEISLEATHDKALSETRRLKDAPK
jgi:hypothetical protein